MNFFRIISAALRPRRHAWLWRGAVAGGLVFVAASWLGAQGGKPDAAAAPAADTPGIFMENFETQITSQGKLKQIIEARAGRLDEDANVMNLTGVHLQFFDQGVPRGDTTCGSGTLWMAPRPAEGIHANDVLLGGHVHYSAADGSIIETPWMRFTSQDQTLHTTAGYLQQIKTDDNYWIGKGDAFEIKLDVQKSVFTKSTFLGHPAELNYTDKPEIQP